MTTAEFIELSTETDLHLPTKSVEVFRRNERIYSPGNTRIVVINSGIVRTSRTDIFGEKVGMAFYATGDVFGEGCLVGSETETAIAHSSKVEVMTYLPSEFLKLLEGDAKLRTAMLALAVRKIEDHRRVLAVMNSRAEVRLCWFLLYLADKIGTSLPFGTKRIQITHDVLGEMVQTSREIITHHLARLRHEGKVSTRHMRIDIDVEALKLETMRSR